PPPRIQHHASRGHPRSGGTHDRNAREQQDHNDIPQRPPTEDRKVETVEPGADPPRPTAVRADRANAAGLGRDVKPRPFRVVEDRAVDRQLDRAFAPVIVRVLALEQDELSNRQPERSDGRLDVGGSQRRYVAVGAEPQPLTVPAYRVDEKLAVE